MEAKIQDHDKTKQQLIDELARLRQKVTRLETSQIKRQQVDEDLLTNQTHIISMIDIANEAIISVDEAQRIFIFNKGAERIFGYSADEVAGQPLDILLPQRFTVIHHQHTAEFATSEVSTRMMGERKTEIFGRRKNGQEFPAEASISKFEIGGKKFFTVVLRDVTERRRMEREREKFIEELKALNEAAQAITSELSLEEVLHKIVESARSLIKVKYAALGVHGGEGRLTQFVTAGIEPEIEAKISAPPAGHGVLSLFLRKGEPAIVEDIASHPASVGFPAHHPVMHSLLGVSIFSKEQLIGALYLSDKQDGSKFDETDQQLTEMLAHHAAIAIENARLYEQTQRLAILEERERFARDLHDGIIQSTYGVGLSLDSAKAAISWENDAARQMIDLSLKSLAQVITDIRNYIFDLRPQAWKDKGLYARLQGLIKELKINTVLSIEADIEPDIDSYVNKMQASHLFHITHEALANVARHAKASRVYIRLVTENNLLILRVEDNGTGFEPPSAIHHGHRGLANIRDRASSLNADLDINSHPGAGTRLTLKVRITEPVKATA